MPNTAQNWRSRNEPPSAGVKLVHRIGVRSEKKVVKTLMEGLKRVHGKTAILFRIAVAAVDNLEGTIKDVVYPVAGEQTLRDLVREYKATGSAYRQEVHETIRTSYGSHYRRMLPAILVVLEWPSCLPPKRRRC